jgi:DNA-3-methyladenine glycosylase
VSLILIAEEFFLRPTVIVAQALVGAVLQSTDAFSVTSGIITETEAYGPEEDSASHAARGRTLRNAPMFERGGTVYVYRSYGLHYCMNFVTENAGQGCAVLIRALLPLEGVATIQERRGLVPYRRLLDGPGKVCQGMGIDASFNYERVPGSPRLQVFHRPHGDPQVQVLPRIGISRSVDLLWRFKLSEATILR